MNGSAASPDPTTKLCRPAALHVDLLVRGSQTYRRYVMAENVYKVVELVGTSTESWEKAASAAVARAAESLRDLRIAEVKELDMTIEDGRVAAYRAKVTVSFKFEGS
jgi:flavin-binding protein dodecin